jgi:hypothetical protein
MPTISIPIDSKPKTIWSDSQKDVFTAVQQDKDNILVQAVAGSGKTTTIVECMNRIPPNKRCGFVAFNKAIADELSGKVPPHVTSKTLHAIGYQALTGLGYKTWKTKTRIILSDLCEQMGIDKDVFFTLLPVTRRVIGMLKANILYETITLYDVMDVAEGMGYPINGEAAQIILDVWNNNAKGKYKQTMDFDDMLRTTVLEGPQLQQYDILFVDEAQDLNGIQHKMVGMMLAPGGRIIAVGDRHQAIYGFRGASTTSMDDLSVLNAMKELPLSVSYRCSESIVEEARKYNPGILAREDAPPGIVNRMHENELHRYRFNMEESHMVLGRYNYDLFKAALRMRLYSQPVYLMGKDIVPAVISTAKMVIKEHNYLTVDRVYAFAKKREGQRGAEAILDNCNIIMLCLEEGVDSVKGVENILYQMFPKVVPKGEHITLCTIHKSKGLEADNVYLIMNDKMPWDKGDVKNVGQEGNLMYVAITRAKKELWYVG